MEEFQDTGVNEGAAVPVEAEANQVQAEEPQPEMVPVTALQAERRERQQLQENMKMLQDHMALMQANQQRPQSQQDDSLDLSDDDVLTVGEAKKFLSKYQQQTDSRLSEIQVMHKHNDYQEVVGKHLPEVIKQNPSLRQTLESDPNRYELAYFLAKNSDSYRESHRKIKKNQDAERIVQNSQQPGSLSAVGHTAPKSSSGNWRNMSDEDFMKQVHKNMGHF